MTPEIGLYYWEFKRNINKVHFYGNELGELRLGICETLIHEAF